MNTSESLSKILQAADSPSWKKAQWIGVREVKETTTHRMVRDGLPELNQSHQSHGWMVEVLCQGQFAYHSTPLRNVEVLRHAVEAAMNQAENAAQYAVFRFTESQRPKTVGKYRSPYLKPYDALSVGEINRRLIKICERLKVSSEVIRTQAILRMVETEMSFASTNGSAWNQSFLMASTHFGAITQKDGTMQRRSDHGHFARSHQMGLEILDENVCLDRASVVGAEAVELLSAPECPTEVTDLVLAPDQMMLQIHESIGHPLELDRILGDERNYAGSSFVKLSDFGQLQYGSKLLNVTFDPHVPGEYASYAFDDSGAPATREYLIQEGKLLRGLGGLESQARSKVPGVANFRSASWNRAPIDRMANLNIEPGQSKFEDLISAIDDGVYMESNLSWSIDDYRNKFQFGCEMGRKIKNGKLTGMIRNPNYRGITVPFWHALKQVGSKETWSMWGTPYCGKGEPNQIIRVGHGSPVCHFSGIEVFGGDQS